MSREIKFRAWLAFSDDQKNHREINGDPYRNGFYIHTKYEIFKRAAGFIANEDLINQVEIQNKSEKLIWEQFTGLKDKNGVEIYEGDALRMNHDDGESNYAGIVDWVAEGDWLGWGLSVGNYIDELKVGDQVALEVIGNIHENPELLGDV